MDMKYLTDHMLLVLNFKNYFVVANKAYHVIHTQTMYYETNVDIMRTGI